MMQNRRPIILAVMLMLATGNYARLAGNEQIRTIQFVSIFVMGALAGLLIQEVSQRLRR